MLKKFLPLLLTPLLLGGCQATFTNLTPHQMTRNTNNVYLVEVALTTRQQTLRWETIRPQVVAGKDSFPLRPTSLLTNRWEGLLPVPSGVDTVQYHYRFDFAYGSFGKPKQDSARSPVYTLKILDQPQK